MNAALRKRHLIWVAVYANMGRHIMKTTIEIADDLFERAQRVARKEKTTFRSLTEQGLRLVLKERQSAPQKRKWKPIEGSERASWRELRAGLQLASRSGPIDEEEIAAFNEEIARFAASINAVSQRESPAAAAARALELDRFCAETDIEVVVNVIGRGGATFSIARVKALGLERGMSETATGTLERRAPDGSVAYVIRRFEREGTRHEAAYATGLTFALDVPHVSDAPGTLAEMVALAQTFSMTFGGELVDDNRRPLTQQGLAAIRRSLEQVFQQMEARGIPAGGTLARRLFA